MFTIRPDGSGVRQITRAITAQNPDWSPDGKKIVLELDRRDGSGIAVISADGTAPRNLTLKGFQCQPSFSPDGKWIAYERDPAPGKNGVWLMRRDGTGLRQLTRNPFKGGGCGCDTDPNFSPDGKQITFVRIKKEDELQALISIRRDGTGLRQVTP